MSNLKLSASRTRIHALPRLALACLSLCLITRPARADSGEAGQPGAFLREGVGSRALAMGNAYVAVASGPETAVWNPAGLALMDHAALGSSVAALSLGRQFADASFAYPIGDSGGGWGDWSLTWLHFSLGNDFEGRTSDTATYYTFGDNQDAYILSHGRMLASWLAVGVGLEYMDHQIDVYRANGFGADLGVLVIPHPKLHIGISLTELASQLQWSTGLNEQIPYTLRIGVSALILGDWLLLSTQATGVQGESANYQAGFEVRFGGLLFARAGVNEVGFTAGGGASVPVYKTRMNVDYAFAPDILGSGNSQRFSLGITF
jgi:hypothetical protein